MGLDSAYVDRCAVPPRPFPVPFLLQSKPQPGMASPGGLGGRRPMASIQAGTGRPAQSFPDPSFHLARPGRERPSLSPSASSRYTASSSNSAQPTTPLGLGVRGPLPGSEGQQLGQPRDRLLLLQPPAVAEAPRSPWLTWKGWGDDRSCSRLAPTAAQRGHAFYVLWLRAASTSCKFLSVFFLLSVVGLGRRKDWKYIFNVFPESLN